MARVAFIGLGRMGHGMAGRYLDAGFTVSVWNRSKAKADDLVARGARWATSPEDAAIDADAVVTMVADDQASRDVWLTKDGAAATMKAGTLAIECSTVSHAHAHGTRSSTRSPACRPSSSPPRRPLSATRRARLDRRRPWSRRRRHRSRRPLARWPIARRARPDHPL